MSHRYTALDHHAQKVIAGSGAADPKAGIARCLLGGSRGLQEERTRCAARRTARQLAAVDTGLLESALRWR